VVIDLLPKSGFPKTTKKTWDYLSYKKTRTTFKAHRIRCCEWISEKTTKNNSPWWSCF